MDPSRSYVPDAITTTVDSTRIVASRGLSLWRWTSSAEQTPSARSGTSACP